MAGNSKGNIKFEHVSSQLNLQNYNLIITLYLTISIVLYAPYITNNWIKLFHLKLWFSPLRKLKQFGIFIVTKIIEKKKIQHLDIFGTCTVLYINLWQKQGKSGCCIYERIHYFIAHKYYDFFCWQNSLLKEH